MKNYKAHNIDAIDFTAPEAHSPVQAEIPQVNEGLTNKLIVAGSTKMPYVLLTLSLVTLTGVIIYYQQRLNEQEEEIRKLKRNLIH
jgi:hypothetical protein